MSDKEKVQIHAFLYTIDHDVYCNNVTFEVAMSFGLFGVRPSFLLVSILLISFYLILNLAGSVPWI